MVTLHKAVIRYGNAELKRTFIDCENALKWLISHAIGQYYINNIEYTRQTIKQALTK